MRNHHQKQRDMARSVLPSTLGSAAERRRRIHRRERAGVRAALREARRTGDGFDDHLDGHLDDHLDGHLDDHLDDHLDERLEVGVDLVTRRRIAELVADRRSCDKVGPLLRWAERTVECDPVLAQADLDQCLAHFRRTLPVDLIGRHALFHIEWVLRGPWWSAVPVGDRRTRTEERDRRLRAALEVIVAAGAVGQLNRILKVSFPAVRRRERGVPTPDRNEQARFHGVHDVERFATFAARSFEASSAVLRLAASLDG